MKQSTVMIIGAGGSLGSVLTGVLINRGYRVVAVDTNENQLMCLYRLYQVSPYHEDMLRIDRMKTIIEDESVSTVVNCAAMKHVGWCEKNILNAIDVNVVANVRLAEHLHKIGKGFVYISSDKAIEPTNIYALTKQFADYVITKYGFKLVRGVNFLNSRGSVLDIWEQQRINGREFTVVKEPCCRYFITLQQMADAVVRAIESECGSEFFPHEIYSISVENLFLAYLKLHQISFETAKIRRFEKPTHEKVFEALNFKPCITSLDSIDKITDVLKEIIR